MPRQLLCLLADGQLHSGESLGCALGLSRAAIWKQVQRLIDAGIVVQRVQGAGYRLDKPVSVLDEERIRRSLAPSMQNLVSALEVHWSLPSTNNYCLAHVQSHRADGAVVCLAEMQTAGRGRRGRVWQSPLAANLYLSVGWQFAGGIAALEGLSLAVGVAVADALVDQFALCDVKLKWPNDILLRDKKLGGILIEMAGDAEGPCSVVVGLGLNVAMPVSSAKQIDQAWTDLESELLSPVSRNELCAAVLSRLLPLLHGYERGGGAAYLQRWNHYDAFANRAVILQQGEHGQSGLCRGVTSSGGLLLDVEGVLQEFRSGEVSLRAV